MNTSLKNTLRYTLFIAIAAILLYFAIKGTNFNDLVGHLKVANYWWVGLSVLMGYSAVVSRGYRWVQLLQPLGYKARVWSSIHAVGFGYMFNIFVPRGGELGRCGVMNRAEKVPVDKLFGTVILERVIDLFFLALIVLIGFLLNIDNFTQLLNNALNKNPQAVEAGGHSLKIIVFVTALFLGILLLVFRKRIINHPKFDRVRSFWQGIKEGFVSFKKVENKFVFIAHTVYIWTMYFFMVYICFFSLPETTHLTIADGFFIMVAASLGIVIPAPGGMGSYHYLVTITMLVLGIDKSVGFTFATIVHTSQTVMLLAAGLLALAYFSLVKKREAHEHDIQSEPKN